MRIFNFEDFVINELQKYVSDRTQSGKTKWIDWVYDEPTTAKSHSASVLLKKKYSELEDNELKNLIGNNTPNWVIRRIKNDPAKYLKLRVTLNNLKFLKDKQKEGPLYCEYCNKGPLIIYDFNEKSIEDAVNNPYIRFNTKFNQNDGATCDHKQPQSKDGDKFDYSNLAVSCYRCNRKKGNMEYEDWTNFLNSENGKDWIDNKEIKIRSKERKEKNQVSMRIPSNIERGLPPKRTKFKDTDFKVGDDVWLRRGKSGTYVEYLGKISDIIPNERHPNKALSARIEGKDPKSLYSLSQLGKRI